MLCTPPDSVSVTLLYGTFGSVTGFWVIVEMPPCHLPRRTGFRSYESSGAGGVNVSTGTVFRASSMKARHIGATISPESLWAIGVLSLLPAQVPTTIDGV